MQFIDLKKRAGAILNLLDSSSAFLTGRDITEAQLGNWINDAYIEDVFSMLSAQYPMYYERQAYVANYTTTGVVDAASTGSTLVATTNLFNNSMIGLYVENTTDNTTTQITDYTNATTVTVSDTIGDTWDGDSIRVINSTYTLSGNASDFYMLEEVTMRATTTSQYIRAIQRFEKDLFQNLYSAGSEPYNTQSPVYYLTKVQTTTGPINAFTLLPLLKNGDDKCVYIKYIEKPALLSADSDEPFLPLGHHEFIYWKAVANGMVMRGDINGSMAAQQKFEQGKRNLVAQFTMTSMDQPISARLPRDFYNMYKRYK